MKVFRPDSIEQAVAILAESAVAVTPIAGGTDVMVSWPQHNHQSMTLLDLSRLEALRYIRMDEQVLELGALATYWDLMNQRPVAAEFPLLASAARVVGAIQIQTRGTWAGNIANGSPGADGVPAMMACDAQVVLQSRAGQRRVPLDEFFTGYRQSVRRGDELIVAVQIPRRVRKAEWYFKVGARAAQAIAKVGVAMLHDSVGGWRVAVSSVAPVVKRCGALESALNAGRRLASIEDVLGVLSGDISPIDDVRSTAEYRRRVLSRLLWYRLRELNLA